MQLHLLKNSKMQSETIELKRILDALCEAKVDFVLIGGLALSAHGSDYVTKDFDAAVKHDHETAEAICSALKPFHPRPRGMPSDLPFVWDETFIFNMSNLTLDTDLGDVDFLTEPDGAPPYAELRARATSRNLYGRDVLICSIDDLIAMKTAAGRVKDQLHLLELQAIKKILAEQNAPDESVE